MADFRQSGAIQAGSCSVSCARSTFVVGEMQAAADRVFPSEIREGGARFEAVKAVDAVL